MIQFFAPDLKQNALLPQDESLHCVRVLRHREGDLINVVDGKGSRYLCRIVDADPRAVVLRIEQETPIPTHWGCNVTLAVAPTKNMDRMEWMVEKAVEIGVDRIVPLLCGHSERKVVKTERLRKIAVSAMKQSLKAKLPEIDELTPIKDFLAENSTDMKFMGYCDKDYPRRELIGEYRPGRNVRILIGPEGDFSPEEVHDSVKKGYVPVTFGLSRLRTETAAISSLDTIHLLNNLAKLSDLSNDNQQLSEIKQ